MPIFYRRLPRFKYVRPASLEETLSLLAQHREKARLLAGGTDLVPQLKGRQIPLPDFVVDIKDLIPLRSIAYGDKGLSIGALATVSNVAESSLIREHYPVLVQTALSMASPQVRNRGTFVGNICTAVPSADSAPSLLALDGALRLKGPGRERVVPVSEFFVGPRETTIEPDEIVLSIEVPQPPPASRSVYLKLSPRHSMDLAVVGVAAIGKVRDGVCEDVRIAVGAVAPTPMRAPMAENMLQGRKITRELIDEAARNAVTQCDPINDHRASREYRCDMVHVMVRRALSQVLSCEG
jgi:CO/xanthine dehydrogenase FAD-binding subunit